MANLTMRRVSSPVSEQSAHRHAVLVVDDEPEIRSVFVEALTADGHDAAAASDGIEALRLLHDGWQPCLVLADVVMPGMNGHELRSSIESHPALCSLPVVVVSSYPAVPDASTNPKPMDLAELGQLIDNRCTGIGTGGVI
jgi:CheY-like chemotaxis protein